MMEIFIFKKFVNMNRRIERVVSQTIKEFINENCTRPSIIKENDGDDMSIYKELDDKVYDICYRHGFNVQTRVGNDKAYYAFFVADDRLPKVQEAIQMLEELGLRRISNGSLSGQIHYGPRRGKFKMIGGSKGKEPYFLSWKSARDSLCLYVKGLSTLFSKFILH